MLVSACGTTAAQPAAGAPVSGIDKRGIKIGISQPESGPAAVYGQLGYGLKAYRKYVSSKPLSSTNTHSSQGTK